MLRFINLPLKDHQTLIWIFGHIFASLEEISGYATPELQLTDAISHMLQHNEKVFAYKIEGTRYDVGTPRGWLKTVVDLGLQDPLYKEDIMQLVQQHSNQFYRADAPGQKNIIL